MSDATHFGALDWAVVAGYFIGITSFGLWLSRQTRTSGGYFLGERKLPWWVMVGQAFGTGTHAEQPVAQAGATFDKRFATIWFQWENMLITPVPGELLLTRRWTGPKHDKQGATARPQVAAN